MPLTPKDEALGLDIGKALNSKMRHCCRTKIITPKRKTLRNGGSLPANGLAGSEIPEEPYIAERLFRTLTRYLLQQGADIERSNAFIL